MHAPYFPVPGSLMPLPRYRPSAAGLLRSSPSLIRPIRRCPGGWRFILRHTPPGSSSSCPLAREPSVMSNMSGAFIGSSVGAAVGCLAWIGVGWATGYELGILAVGVGTDVCVAAAAGAKGRAGTSGAIVAALVAIASIVVARYVLLQMAIEKDIA